jgi:hypothetical protein
MMRYLVARQISASERVVGASLLAASYYADCLKRQACPICWPVASALPASRPQDAADRSSGPRHRRRCLRPFARAEDRYGRRGALFESGKRGQAAFQAADLACDARDHARLPATGDPRPRTRLNPSRGPGGTSTKGATREGRTRIGARNRHQRPSGRAPESVNHELIFQQISQLGDPSTQSMTSSSHEKCGCTQMPNSNDVASEMLWERVLSLLVVGASVLGGSAVLLIMALPPVLHGSGRTSFEWQASQVER